MTSMSLTLVNFEVILQNNLDFSVRLLLNSVLF